VLNNTKLFLYLLKLSTNSMTIFVKFPTNIFQQQISNPVITKNPLTIMHNSALNSPNIPINITYKATFNIIYFIVNYANKIKNAIINANKPTASVNAKPKIA